MKLALLAALLFAIPAQADSPPPLPPIAVPVPVPPDIWQPYSFVGVAALLGVDFPSRLLRPETDNTSPGISAQLGRRLHPHLAVLADFDWLDSSTSDSYCGISEEFIPGRSANQWATTLEARAYTDTEARYWLDAYALLGVGAMGTWNDRSHEETFTLKAGAGLSRHLGRGFDVVVETAYLYATTGSHRLPSRLVSQFGLQRRF